MINILKRIDELNNTVFKDVNRIEYALLLSLEYYDFEEVEQEDYSKLFSLSEHIIFKDGCGISDGAVTDTVARLYQEKNVFNMSTVEIMNELPN